MHEICKLLSDGQFHSGSRLGQQLGITRAAVWKKIKKLEQYGVQVETRAGQGYRLPQGIRLLEPELLRAQIPAAVAVHALVETDSTNAEAVRMLRAGDSDFIVLAEQQTQGRGRRGRQWHSPYASNLYFSYAWSVTKGVQQLEALSLAVGLAVYRALSRMGVADLGVKWPNDLLVANKKIAGILVELVGDITDRCNAVIGIGINVNMCAQQDIEQPWTSLQLELQRPVDRNQLLIEVFAQLQQVLLTQFEHGFAPLQREWEQAHAWQGRHAQLCFAERQLAGQILGITESGQLRMLIDGSEQQFAGGELSLRLSSDS